MLQCRYMEFTKKDIEEHKALAAIGYLFILFLVPLMGAKHSAFAQHHGRQGIAVAVFGVVVMVINTLIGWIPLIGWLIAIVLSLAWAMLTIIGIIKAISGETWEVPVLGKWAAGLKF
jgi:uncharacterized membrane protein